MTGRGVACRRIFQDTGPRLGFGHELGHRIHRQRRSDVQVLISPVYDGDGRQIAFGVVRHLCDQARRRQESRGDDTERVTVRRRLSDRVESDRPDGARAIFDHDRLPHRSGKTLADETGEYVGYAARSGRNDELDGPVGIGGGAHIVCRHCHAAAERLDHKRCGKSHTSSPLAVAHRTILSQ